MMKMKLSKEILHFNTLYERGSGVHTHTHTHTQMILHARDNAVPFYKSIGCPVKEKSYLLFDEILHYLKIKVL